MSDAKIQLQSAVDDPTNRIVTALVMRGFNYDQAMMWTPEYRSALLIICGQLEGEEWDWDRMKWKPRESF